MAKNTLTFKTRFDLANWLREPGRLEDKTTAELAAEVSKDLGLKISWQQVFYVINELKLPYTAKKGRGHTQVPAELLQTIEELKARVTELEASMKLLKSFYVNTTKEPRGQLPRALRPNGDC